MSVRYGFYNSLNGDRKYSAEDFSSIFNGVIKDGVFQSIGKAMIVKPLTGMDVLVQSGRAWFNGTWTDIDSDLAVSIPAAGQIFDRIDAVVLEINHSSEVRANSIKVVQGTASSVPERPTLTHTELIDQYPLAYIRVRYGTTTINASDITNAVGTSECPFVTGVLETLDVSELLSKWNGEFSEWLNHLADIVDQPTAEQIVANYGARLAQAESDITNVEQTVHQVVEAIHPVGSVYISFSNVDPNIIFGFGTWELLKDRFLIGAGNKYNVNATGGEETHVLTIAEMPSHNHSRTRIYTSQGEGGSSGSGYSGNDASNTTSSTGGSQPHNNMPPYLAVYMWKRIS